MKNLEIFIYDIIDDNFKKKNQTDVKFYKSF